MRNRDAMTWRLSESARAHCPFAANGAGADADAQMLLLLMLLMRMALLCPLRCRRFVVQLVAGSRCLDGTDAGYYYRASTTVRAVDRWVFYLQGGGLCYDPGGCKSRAISALGSSIYWAPTYTGFASQSESSVSASSSLCP